jgi:hypothetical protein
MFSDFMIGQHMLTDAFSYVPLAGPFVSSYIHITAYTGWSLLRIC